MDIKERSLTSILAKEPGAVIQKGHYISINDDVEGEKHSNVTESFLDNVPPEVLSHVLCYVDTQSLFKCRLVNRKWSELSSTLLRKRQNLVLRFEFTSDQCLWSTDEMVVQKTLHDYLSCMLDSANYPFTRFAFTITDETDALQFFEDSMLKNFTSHFMTSTQQLLSFGLSFDFCTVDDKLFKKSIKQLGVFLLNRIPQVQELHLDIFITTPSPDTTLFPTTDSMTVNTSVLPNLKVFRCITRMPMYTPGIVGDILKAAVNINCISMWVFNSQDLHFLHNMGKVHLVKNCTIIFRHGFFSPSTTASTASQLSLSNLETLHIDLCTFVTNQEASARVTGFLGQIFSSSRNSLLEFRVQPIGCFLKLQLPSFSKLRKLELVQCNNHHQQLLPSNIRTNTDFSTVTQLELRIVDWTCAFPNTQSIPVLPRVTCLIIGEGFASTIDVSIVSLMCPALTKLYIQKNGRIPLLNLAVIGRDIWTHLKTLTSLEVDVDMELSENNPIALDSCFTGISLKNCKRIYSIMKSTENMMSLGRISHEHDLNLESLCIKEYPSILDMKELMTLTIHPYNSDELEPPIMFFEHLTFISEEYAFKFMDHLKPLPQ